MSLPDANILLTLDDIERAGIVLEFLHSLSLMQKRGLDSHDYFREQSPYLQQYPVNYQERVIEALMEGWSLLVREGFLFEISHRRFKLSGKADSVRTTDDLREYFRKKSPPTQGMLVPTDPSAASLDLDTAAVISRPTPATEGTHRNFKWLMRQGAEMKEQQERHISNPTFASNYSCWLTDIKQLIEDELGQGSIYFAEINDPRLRSPNCLAEAFGILEAAHKRYLGNTRKPQEAKEVEYSYSSSQLVEHIINRLHITAKQLLKRRANRQTLQIADEYDVQDLLHALLRLFFDDVRPEEWAPSYAGGSSRMDFLLKKDSIVIETKKTRDGLEAKEVGDQLLIDIARYKEHPFCKTLICFVYDPEERIANPRGLENDLSKQENGFTVNVLIAPKRH